MRNNSTKRTTRQAPALPRDPTHPNAPKDRARAQPDYALTNQERVVRKSARQTVTLRVKKHLSGETVKSWRKAHGWSAQKLATDLGGYGRSYIKSIEGGSLPASQKFIERFNELRVMMGERKAEHPHDKETTAQVVAAFALPKSFEIKARPVRCAACRAYFIPRTVQQIFCGPRCAKRGRKQAERRKHETKN